jgi:hypothetical protein
MGAAEPWGAICSILPRGPQKFKHPIFSIFIAIKLCFNLLSSLHIIYFTAMMYLNQLRAIKCFLKKIAMMGKVIGVPQNTEYVFRVPSVKRS